MKAGSLFSGGGLGDYGLELAGMEIAFQVEKDDYCQKILNLRWPDVPKWRDIREIDPKDLPRVDLISGGFPCQPFSLAGKRRGKEDDRYLWPEMRRIIEGLRPTWVLGENVPGIIKMGLDEALSDLEALGYATRTFVIPACAVEAPHRRDRVWIVGYSNSKRLQEQWVTESVEKARLGIECPSEDVADSSNPRVERMYGRENPAHEHGWPTGASICRVSHGTPNRVDRIELLGNGQVVPLVTEIGRMIMEINDAHHGC